MFHVYRNVILLYIYVHTHTYTHIYFFRFFSIIGYYKVLNIVPCAIQ